MATTGLCSNSNSGPPSNGLKAADIQHLLRQKIAVLSGGRDKNGRPVITCPSRDNAEKTSFDDLRMVLLYLHAIPSDETKECGFVVLIDMRHGMTWNAVKPILKTLQDHFPGTIHAVYIIKPDKFWEKHRTSIASAKYKFEVHMISVDNLPKYIDTAQLTPEFDGTLLYDHEEWLELRIALEDLIWRCLDVLRVFDTMKEELEDSQMPVDVETAHSALDSHSLLKKRIAKAPVEQLEQEGQQLIHRLTGIAGEEGSVGGGADSDYGSAGRDSQINPDFSAAAPNVLSLLENLRTTRQNLYSSWQNRKQKLDQCFQLQLFQQDAEKMFKWIRESIEIFLSSYANIGDSHEEAQILQCRHEDFSRTAMNTYVSISHIMTVAERLIEGGHYASPKIQASANRLDKDWKLFAKSLDLRAAVLTLSVNFHYKSKQYLSNVAMWMDRCSGRDLENIPCTVNELEQAIHQHQQLIETFTQAYSEAVHDGKALVHTLKHPPSISGSLDECGVSYTPSSLPTTPDYTAGANHVLSVIHGLVAHQRQLEDAGQQRRVQLHQRLALVLFQQDVKQVLDWLDNHGENFLRKNVGIGKTLSRARALQKSQQHFENVAKNTYGNAEKLLAAAEDLAGTGECQPQEVYGVAQELRRRISCFAKQVQSRRHLLNLSVLFHTHYGEMLSWYNEVEREDASCEVIGDSLNQCERNLDTWLSRTDATLQAYATIIQEGQQLAGLLRQQAAAEKADNAESSACVEAMLGEIEKRDHFSFLRRYFDGLIRCGERPKASNIELTVPTAVRHTRLAERWSSQRLAMQLAIKYSLLKQDCLTVGSQLEGWKNDMRQMVANLTPAQAEKHSPLHQENTAHVHSAMLEIMSSANEQIQMLENTGLELRLPDGSVVLHSILSLTESIRNQEREIMVLADRTQTRLEQAQQLGRLQTQAAQVVSWINKEESVLAATLALPTTLAEAEQAQATHQEFQIAVKRTNQNALNLQEKAEQMLACDHYDPVSVRGLAEDVLGKWRRLVGLTEERSKLLSAAVTYYKVLEPMMPLLDNLASDYEQDRDWCSLYSRQSSANTDKVSFTAQLLSRHMDNKDKFLRGCTYARKNSELLLKFVRRCGSGAASTVRVAVEQTEQRILERLELIRQRENHILQLWTKKKRQLDECRQFVLLEASAKDVLDWLHQDGEVYLSTHAQTQTSRAREQVEKLLDEHLQFKANAKEQREKVRLFLELADGVKQEDGHRHSTDIKQWMETVQERYTDFSQRMEKLERKLQNILGRQEQPSRDLALDRQSDPNLEPKLPKEFTEARRKSARQKDYIMAEMLQTERIYVKDLRTCIEVYLEGMRKSSHIPACLRGMEEDIFCNLEQIYQFHEDIFVKELEKYEAIPEDVGHCFVSWVEKFRQLHVLYCKNHSKSNHLIGQSEALQFFADIQQKNSLSMPLQAYLIKPVQRITKYQLLLSQLCSCCEEAGEVGEALEVMLNVPKRANDIIHLSALDGCPELERLGDILLQDSLQVWDPKQLIKKGRERQVFLFELSIVFSKKIVDTQGQKEDRYAYKYRLMISEINVTEHIEGDQCKFALWTGSRPINEYRTILRAPDYKSKVTWVTKLRELINQRNIYLDLPHLRPSSKPVRTVPATNPRDTDSLSQTTESSAEVSGVISGAGDGISVHSYASTVSSNDLESGKSQCELSIILEDHCASNNPTGQISVVKRQQVEVLQRSESYPDWFVVRAADNLSEGGTPVTREGIVPFKILGSPPSDQDQSGSHLETREGEEERNLVAGNNADDTALIGMKRKSFKKWFTPAITANSGNNSKQHPKLNQRQLSADPASNSAPTRESQEQLQRKGGSVYSKFKLSDKTVGVIGASRVAEEEQRTVTPPLASEEDLQENEQLSSAKQTPSTDNHPSLVLSAEPGTVTEESALPHDIEIPPPMESLASDKLIMNGQHEPSSPLSKTSVTMTPGGGESSEEMAQELEAMVRLRVANSTGEEPEEGVGEEGNAVEESGGPSPSDSAAENKTPEELAKEKRRYVLMEMVETEKDYVRDLGTIVDGYIFTVNNMELPDEIKGKDRIVFANIQNIYEFHKMTFQKELEKCLEDYEAAGRAFVKHERRLRMYVVYCQNKPKSEFLIQQELEAFFLDIKQKLGHKLSLSDLLIKPVQRIMKYQLLLKDILKYTDRSGEDTETMKKALQVMHVIPKECDDMMHVGRLQGFNETISSQGKLLAQGTFLVSENPPTQVFKGKERRIFIFEQSLIIADYTAPKKEFSNPNYIYKSHIKVNKMKLEADCGDEPLRFVLKSNDPTAPQEFLLQAASMQEKDLWIAKIRQLEDQQKNMLIALQNPRKFQEQQNLDASDKRGKEDKKSKSPIMNRLGQFRPGGKDSHSPGGAVSGGAGLSADSAGEPRKHSLPSGTQQSASPKTKSKGIFDNFRNPLKSKTGLGVKSPSSPPPVGGKLN